MPEYDPYFNYFDFSSGTSGNEKGECPYRVSRVRGSTRTVYVLSVDEYAEYLRLKENANVRR